MLLLVLAAAHAGDVFASVGAETSFGMGGTWARMMSTEAGYWFFQVAGGDVWAEDVGDDLSGYDDRKRVQLTHHGKIQDGQLERCPDGGYLVIGSYTLDSFDDSAQAWRLEADFSERWHVTVAERDSSHKHNDMVPICTVAGEGVAFAGAAGGSSNAVYVPLDGASVGGEVSLGSVAVEGASSAPYQDDGASLLVTVDGFGSSSVAVVFFDTEWNPVDEVTVQLTDDRVVWPQRVQALGDGWLLTYLTNPQNAPSGDVWLAALDKDFALLDQVLVHDGGGQDNRPWFARKDDSVVVTYDRDVQPRQTVVTLVSGAGGDDDGILDTAAPDDDTGPGAGDSAGADDPDDATTDCMCATSSGVPVSALGLLITLGLSRRRAR